MKKYDWLVRGGRVIDPLNKLDFLLDVGILNGQIADVSSKIDPGTSANVYDARGQIVTPGLIDLHVHGYEYVTPLGIPVDQYCLGRGVTTAVDAGSAGCATFRGFASSSHRMLHGCSGRSHWVAGSNRDIRNRRVANVTVLSLKEVDIELEDCQSQMRRVRQRLVPRAVWYRGIRAEITRPQAWPNMQTIAAQKRMWSQLEIRDPVL